ncbi:MAG: hypothetical protein WCX78_04560, partial [Patescibacteria group bacterium]
DFMPGPKVRFQIDEKKDIKTFFCFSDDTEYDGGRSLNWAILKKYPELKEQFKDNVFVGEKKYIEEFVLNLYQNEEKVMNENLELYEKKWRKIEKEFYRLTDALFPLRKWPVGKYISYPTIWGMYPRFLDDKTFQVPFNAKEEKSVNIIIAHEMLHFVFYDYFLEKYPEYDEHSMVAWHTSEIFNVIIQNLPEWIKVFEIPSGAYPEHEKIITEIQNEKREVWAVDELTERILVEVKKMDK